MPTSYPAMPGSKGTGTSALAAQAMSGSAAIIRDRCMAILRDSSDGLTADEVAARLGASVLTVRPRISELKRLGSIVDTKRRRRNASGNTAAIWIARLDGGARG